MAAALGLLVGVGSSREARADGLYVGYVAVTDTANSTALGYISNTFNRYGEYTVTSSLANALQVSFMDAGTPFSMTELNNGASTANPYVGAIVGYGNTSANLGAGSNNYAYLGGTVYKAAGSAPTALPNSFAAATGVAEDTESSIWSLSNSDVLTAQWTDTNLSSPATIAEYAQSALTLTGDPTAFQNSFGAATPIAFALEVTSYTPVETTPEPGSLWLVGTGAAAMLGAARRRLRKAL